MARRPEELVGKCVVLVLGMRDLRLPLRTTQASEVTDTDVRASQQDLHHADHVLFVDGWGDTKWLKRRGTRDTYVGQEQVFISRPKSFEIFDIQLPGPY